MLGSHSFRTGTTPGGPRCSHTYGEGDTVHGYTITNIAQRARQAAHWSRWRSLAWTARRDRLVGDRGTPVRRCPYQIMRGPCRVATLSVVDPNRVSMSQGRGDDVECSGPSHAECRVWVIRRRRIPPPARDVAAAGRENLKSWHGLWRAAGQSAPRHGCGRDRK